MFVKKQCTIIYSIRGLLHQPVLLKPTTLAYYIPETVTFPIYLNRHGDLDKVIVAERRRSIPLRITLLELGCIETKMMS